MLEGIGSVDELAAWHHDAEKRNASRMLQTLTNLRVPRLDRLHFSHRTLEHLFARPP
jgi:hypothetical protein